MPLLLNLFELIIIWITGTIDPGIMKRNENCFGCHELPIKIVHKGVFKTTKICLTCNIARPFRSTHCSDCDNCTLRFDHNCPWIGGCVGKRNYIYFFIFLILLNIKNVYLLIFSIIHICKTYMNSTDEEKKIKSWIARKLLSVIPSLFTIIFIGATMLFTTGLIIYHINLIIKNITTKEEIKKLLPLKVGNPYDRGAGNNCNEFWTRHKSMENNYTVKDLRVKVKPEKKVANVGTKKFRPKIMPYSEKEKKLKNKEKNKGDIKERFYNENENNNDKKAKASDNQSDSKSNKSKATYSEKSQEENKAKNNNEVINNIKKKFNKKSKDSKSNSNSKNEDKSSKKSSSSYTENNNNNEVDNYSDEEISDENDNTNRKICNTSYKNKNNLNDKINNKFNEDDNKLRFKTNLTNDENLNYKIAQQRLEELSSEITIHEEINQLKSSLSIPRENSCTFSLSES